MTIDQAKKSEQFMVRMSPEDLAALDRVREPEGLTRSQAVRTLILRAAAALACMCLLLACGGGQDASSGPAEVPVAGTEGKAFCAALEACDAGYTSCLPASGGECTQADLDECVAAIQSASCDTLQDPKTGPLATEACQACKGPL